jgi:prevent-host-death family protein
VDGEVHQVNLAEVSIHEAKTHLSRLLERVQQGEEIVIVDAGQAIAKLVGVEKPSPRKFGTAKGTVKFHPGWNDSMTAEELAEFIGE